MGSGFKVQGFRGLGIQRFKVEGSGFRGTEYPAFWVQLFIIDPTQGYRVESKGLRSKYQFYFDSQANSIHPSLKYVCVSLPTHIYYRIRPNRTVKATTLVPNTDLQYLYTMTLK